MKLFQSKNRMFRYTYFFSTAILLLTSFMMLNAQESAKEEDFFKINKIHSPEGMVLEVGGLCTMPDGNLAVTTRRGDVYIVENPTGNELID